MASKHWFNLVQSSPTCLYHVSPGYWPMCRPTIGPRGYSWVVPRGITWGCHMSHFHWPIWWPKVPNQHAMWHTIIVSCQHADVTATVLATSTTTSCTDAMSSAMWLYGLPHVYHVLYVLPCGCTDCHMSTTSYMFYHVVVRSAMWLYSLPRGTFSLVHMST
jgi:hypothetical protein